MAPLAVLGCGVAGFAAAWVLTSGERPSAALSRARASLMRQAVQERLVTLGSTAPLRALAGAGSWRLAAEALDGQAAAYGWRLGREGALAALVLASAAMPLAGAVVAASPVGLVVGAVTSAVAVPAWAQARQRRRLRELAREVPEVFRSLASALGAGRTLSQAVSYVGSSGTGPVSLEFRRASMALSCGMSAEDALADLAQRAEAPGMGLMVTALTVSRRTGAPLHDLFLRSARLVERQGEFEQALRAKTAQARLSARIVSVLPAALVGLLALVSPDFRRGLATPVGTGCVCVATLLDALALLIINRLMKGVV